MAKSSSLRPASKPPRTGLPAEQQADQLYQRALAALKQKQHAQAISHLTKALQSDPLHVSALMLQARVLAEFDKLDSAIELMQLAVAQKPDEPEACFLLARWLTKQGKQRAAAAMMHRCVQLQPNKDAPRRYLAALYGSMGFDEQSRYWAKKAVTSKSFAVREARAQTKLTVLALFTQASGSLNVNRKSFRISTTEGHNNLTGMLDNDHITVIRFYVDTLDRQPELLRKLPTADVIYNSITDPERCEHALHLAQKVCDRLDLPVINEPKAVLGASREGNHTTLKAHPGVVAPRSIKLEGITQPCSGVVKEAIQTQGLRLPLIVRLAGYQAGRYMQLVEDLETHGFAELDAEIAKAPQTLYLIDYHDVSYIDPRLPDTPLFPKYRAFMVDGKLYPVNNIVADSYKVHRANSDPVMNANPWLNDIEQAFNADPETHLGKDHWRNLEAAIAELGLDYIGIDFAPGMDENGEPAIIIFEANAAMRNRLTEFAKGSVTQQNWEAITRHFHELMCGKAELAHWAFVLPQPAKGKAVDEIPLDVDFLVKEPLPDHTSSNHRWLAERLGESNDFSDSSFFNTRHYLDEELLEHTARQQGIRVQRYPGRMLEFTQGQKQTVFHINAPRVPMDAKSMQTDKVLVKELFRRNNIPTPVGQAFLDFGTAYRFFASRSCPQVVKPTNGFASRGVSVHVTTPEQFKAAWQKAKKIGENILVEDMIQGEEIRVYVKNGEFVAATVRAAPFVIGDGINTIKELVDGKNRDRARNPVTSSALINDFSALTRQERKLTEVPTNGEWVVLADSHAVAAGAEFIRLGSELPKPVIEKCLTAAKLLPSTVCGVDLFIENLESPSSYWITEINASTPVIGGMFHFPRYGASVDVATLLLNHAFKHLALPVQPGTATVMPAAPCEAVKVVENHFVTNKLQQLACERNLPVQRPTADALLIGNPPHFGWTEHLSTYTSMESVQVLKQKEWLNQRLSQIGRTKLSPRSGTEVRLLIAGENLLAAHAKNGNEWQDVSESLHEGVAAIASRIMHAIYRPGHALITLLIGNPTADPRKRPWGVKSISLQPNLAMFYANIDQPRDVISALFETFLPDVKTRQVQPVTRRLRITGKVQGVGYRQWLKMQFTLHALKGSVCNVPDGSVDAVVHGQPNAIVHLMLQCENGPEMAEVATVDADYWHGPIPQQITIMEEANA